MDPLSWDQMLDDFAARKALPGCGAASALAGGLGTALLQKVLRLAASDPGGRREAILEALEDLRTRLADAATADGDSYEGVLVALRLPRVTDVQRRERRERLDRALLAAGGPPLAVARAAVEVIDLVEPVVELGKPVTATDAQVAGDLALAAARGALRVVAANLERVSDPGLVEPMRTEAAALLRAATAAKGATGTG